MSSAFRGNTQNNPNHKIAIDLTDAGGESTNGIVPVVMEFDSESHYDDIIMSAIASQITSLTIVYSIVYSDADKKNIKAPRHWPLCGEFTGDR